jgi:lysozyme family protein
MTITEEIIADILLKEGKKYTNHPADRGGPTKWGITQQAWGEYIERPATESDIRNITEQEAYDFYEEVYIYAPSFHKIINENLRGLVVDCGVNHGPGRAARWVQRSTMVKRDGDLGPISLGAINSTDPLEIYLETTAYRIKLYGRIVRKDHGQAVFISGWNNRAASFLEDAGDRIAEGLPPV